MCWWQLESLRRRRDPSPGPILNQQAYVEYGTGVFGADRDLSLCVQAWTSSLWQRTVELVIVVAPRKTRRNLQGRGQCKRSMRLTPMLQKALETGETHPCLDFRAEELECRDFHVDKVRPQRRTFPASGAGGDGQARSLGEQHVRGARNVELSFVRAFHGKLCPTARQLGRDFMHPKPHYYEVPF